MSVWKLSRLQVSAILMIRSRMVFGNFMGPKEHSAKATLLIQVRRNCIDLPVMERGPTGPSDSGRMCVLPVGTDRPARWRPAAATARLHQADSLPSLCADEAALPQSCACDRNTNIRTATLALRSLFKDTPHICLQPFLLW